jgi:transposase-like protein
MTTDHSTERQAAVAMARTGIATAGELARLAGVSRQLMRHWLSQADLDVPRIREERLAREWQRRTRPA